MTENSLLVSGLNEVLNYYFYGISIGFVVSMGITIYYVTKTKFSK